MIPTTTTTAYTDTYGALGLPVTYWNLRGGRTKAAILVYVRYMADPRFEPEPTR